MATARTSSFSYVYRYPFNSTHCLPYALDSSIMNGVADLGTLIAKSFQRSALYLLVMAAPPDTQIQVFRMSPSNFVAQWSTPQLLIHGSKDYRLPETESIGAFHALQQSVL